MLISPDLAARIATHVQNNRHGEAISLVARVLRMQDIAERAEVINRQHDWLGHLPRMLYEERQALYWDMMDAAKKGLSASDYQRLRDAF